MLGSYYFHEYFPEELRNFVKKKIYSESSYDLRFRLNKDYYNFSSFISSFCIWTTSPPSSDFWKCLSLCEGPDQVNKLVNKHENYFSEFKKNKQPKKTKYLF